MINSISENAASLEGLSCKSSKVSKKFVSTNIFRLTCDLDKAYISSTADVFKFADSIKK